MTFRTRLFLLFTAAIVLAVVLVVWAVSDNTSRAFEQRDQQRRIAMVAQLRKEFAQRSAEVTRRVERIAAAESARTTPFDYGDAGTLAQAYGLDLLMLVGRDGAIISSAQWPARFLYKEDWLLRPVAWNSEPAFFKREELPEETVLGIVAVRVVDTGMDRVFIAGGQRIDRQFLASLILPDGLRTMLAQPAQNGGWSFLESAGPAPPPAKLDALLGQAQKQNREISSVVDWGGDPSAAETVTAIPLRGREQDPLGVFLVAGSRRDLVEMQRFLRALGFGAGAAGVLVAVLLGAWAAVRITRPVKRLAEAARRVAAGDWSARVDPHYTAEIGDLARAFNRMTEQLGEQRERLVQAERVAAWRELARRLAHELKNPLFPLQITIENLQRARSLPSHEFDEIFEESTATLLAELRNLKTIIGRFSDFSKMPRPQPEATDLNGLVRDALKLYQAQFAAARVAVALELEEPLAEARVDPEQFGRVLGNLFLNAIDAMPGGGTLTVRTRRNEGTLRVEVADTGKGLTEEECSRLFTPYYTTKQHGTGLGLAIVQSVVSDHGGRIAVASEPEHGTRFLIDLPGTTTNGTTPDRR